MPHFGNKGNPVLSLSPPPRLSFLRLSQGADCKQFLVVSGVFLALALALLWAALRWRVPMMLWDHLDLLPMLQAWRDGNLQLRDLFSVHDGSHLHAAAYVLLLATTELSNGQTWLDVLLSWSLLVAGAIVVVAMARRSLPAGVPIWQWLMLVGLALYPGHLANLQWGWQVAVFVCVSSSLFAIASLCITRLTWWWNGAACTAAIFAWLGFATALALVPVACVLIVQRQGFRWSERIAMSVPWLLLGALAVVQMDRSGATRPLLDGWALLHYSLNFVGSGAVRFATGFAPWLAGFALISALSTGYRLRRDARSAPWLGLLLFGLFAALLTAAGRAAAFGADHAFVQRYVSFSSLFWLGWCGLHILAARQGVYARRWIGPAVAFVAVLLLANALHLVRKAATTGARAAETATIIVATWPDVDDAVLRQIYFDRAELAAARLQLLREYCFAPFGQRGGDPGSCDAGSPNSTE